ncbi:uncharacterized protein UTRI_04381_B [Ustilago trichophora]|uniref:Uncharacterized protein n=1 Tax=Ustilago trichophora TaxID=86804 RepID=A0A5C3ED60_9BASI|nr:uncharacterized protein UTRI_04381_B [Ustilago trichophora]
MVIVQLDDSILDRLADSPPVELPKLTAEQKAKWNVALGTEILYQAHLQCMHDCRNHDGPVISLHPSSSLYSDLALTWWAVTGGWNNVDKAIKDRYPNTFIAAVNFTKQNIEITNTLIQAHRKAKAGSSSSKSTDEPTRSGKPFDVVGATRALFEFSQKALRGPDPHEFESMFAHLATLWMNETGGTANIPKTILDPYPSWFKGKLDMFQHDPHWAEILKKGPPKVNVEACTRDLFEMAKKRYPDAPRGMDAGSNDFQLEMQFRLMVVQWCEMTGGWDKLGKEIRDRYPSWFVKKLESISKKLPLAKVMAFDQYNSRLIIKK